MINRIRYWAKGFDDWMNSISDAAAAAVLTGILLFLLTILGLTIYGAIIGITACAVLLIIFTIVFVIGVIWGMIYDSMTY